MKIENFEVRFEVHLRCPLVFINLYNTGLFKKRKKLYELTIPKEKVLTLNQKEKEEWGEQLVQKYKEELTLYNRVVKHLGTDCE